MSDTIFTLEIDLQAAFLEIDFSATITIYVELESVLETRNARLYVNQGNLTLNPEQS